jgi:hypothetical protein
MSTSKLSAPTDEDLQQYKIPEGWEWEIDPRGVLELYASGEEYAGTRPGRRPVVRVEWSHKPKSYSWHAEDDQNGEEKEFPTIHEAIQYVVTLVGLGMYTL